MILTALGVLNAPQNGFYLSFARRKEKSYLKDITIFRRSPGDSLRDVKIQDAFVPNMERCHLPLANSGKLVRDDLDRAKSMGKSNFRLKLCMRKQQIWKVKFQVRRFSRLRKTVHQRWKYRKYTRYIQIQSSIMPSSSIVLYELPANDVLVGKVFNPT